jgi:hypothetical protein
VKQSLLAIIPLLVLATTLNVYAGGPRMDYPEDATEEGAYCWVDGYDAGFAGKYDKDRAIECVILADDEYNRSWKYACKDAGYMPNECQYFKSHPEDLEHAGLYEENRRHCYDVGYAEGKNSTSFNKKEDGACSEFNNSYEHGFSAGCQSIEGNTDDSCELKIKGYKVYCPNNPDDPACIEFLHDPSNKKPHTISSSVCDQAPYHPGCPQIVDPERYCLNTDDPAFCKTVGDICDEDGTVKPEGAYCKTN